MKLDNGNYLTLKNLESDPQSQLYKQLEQLMPAAFQNGTLNLELLKNVLGLNQSNEINNIFGLYWHDKHKVSSLANQSINNKTLLPVRAKSLNFDQAQNVIIEGDNLQVLKLLTKAYFNQVDVIYIDPPYNTGNDFVYNDDFKQDSYEYKIANNLIDAQGLKTTTNQKSDGRFHTNWLNMIYPRLVLARKLLKDDGVIFISIDDNEQARLKLICDEIFGEHNFITTFIWQKKNSGSSDDAKHIKKLTEYILMYAKNETSLNVQKMFRDLEKGNYKEIDSHVEKRGKYSLNQLDRASLTWSSKLDYEITIGDITYYPGGVTKEQWIQRKTNHAVKDWRWRWSKSKLEWGLANDFIVVKNNKIYTKQYQLVNNENQPIIRQSPYANLILNKDISGTSGTEELKQLFDNLKIFDHPKPIDLIKYLVNLHPNKNALVLDFFAGSGSTAHGVMDLNQQDGGKRQYILVQWPELVDNSQFANICEITSERIRHAVTKYNYDDAGFKYFQLGPTNFDVWKITTDAEITTFKKQLNLFESHSYKLEVNHEAILYELMLKYGLKLDWKIKSQTINNHQFWIDEFQQYLFFLRPQPVTEIVDIIKITMQSAGQVFISESYFGGPNGDEIKINLCETIKQFNLKINLWIV